MSFDETSFTTDGQLGRRAPSIEPKKKQKTGTLLLTEMVKKARGQSRSSPLLPAGNPARDDGH